MFLHLRVVRLKRDQCVTKRRQALCRMSDRLRIAINAQHRCVFCQKQFTMTTATESAIDDHIPGFHVHPLFDLSG